MNTCETCEELGKTIHGNCPWCVTQGNGEFGCEYWKNKEISKETHLKDYYEARNKLIAAYTALGVK